MTPAGVQRIFTMLGLGEQSKKRLKDIAKDGRSAAQIRDDLLAWAKKQGGDQYQKMLQSYVAAQFESANQTVEQDRIERIAAEIAGGRDIDEVRTTIADFKKEADGSDPDAPGLMSGGETIKVGDRYYQVYEFPPGSGSFISYQFESREQVEATLGKDFSIKSRSQTWFDKNVLAQASVEEVVGRTGSWQRFTQDLMQEAAMNAGVRDPSLAGQLANDPEMQQIMAQALAGNWSPEQIRAEQRRTNFWKNTLYPGIQNFYGSSANPEQAWRNYYDSVEPALQALGYQQDSNGTFNKQIKQMLDKGIDKGTFLQNVPHFIQAQQNAEFASALNLWAQREGRSIKFNDWFDIVAGTSAPELDAIVEKAQLQWISQNQGTQLSRHEISRIADRSQLTQAEMAAAFSEFNQGLLALGEAGLGRYGLTRDELLSVSAGIAPESGRTIEEVKLNAAKAARELELFDEDKINFFVGFTPQGAPHRPGLAGLRPEAG